MKPLSQKDVGTLLKRFENFRGGELRDIKIVSPTAINLILAGQDSARGFDWITVEFEFSGVDDARVIENSKLSHVDLDEGVNIICENGKFAFGIGDRYNTSGIKNAICYIISSNLKYQEGEF